MIKANNTTELSNLLEKKANAIIEKIADSNGFSIEEIDLLDINGLNKILKKVSSIIEDDKKIQKFATVSFRRDQDYYLPPQLEPTTVGYGYTASFTLLERKKYILQQIKSKSKDAKLNSLVDLVESVSDRELKDKLNSELREFQIQSNQFDKQEIEISNEEKKIKAKKQELEIFEKKSQIWLTILAKESIASILGGILLLVLSICLVVAMFMDINTTNIIESAFLLILGYFFGQAVSKK
jgi:hypothetical protein